MKLSCRSIVAVIHLAVACRAGVRTSGLRRALLILAISLFSASITASESEPPEPADQQSDISADQSLDIKRQIMSRPGVFLDMANLTDNGYVWSNDVVWEGADLPTNEKWYIAAFLFHRDGYKTVWLQYAFTMDEASGKVVNFQRWYGALGFR